jgi:hypothetical protein
MARSLIELRCTEIIRSAPHNLKELFTSFLSIDDRRQLVRGSLAVHRIITWMTGRAKYRRFAVPGRDYRLLHCLTHRTESRRLGTLAPEETETQESAHKQDQRTRLWHRDVEIPFQDVMVIETITRPGSEAEIVIGP